MQNVHEVHLVYEAVLTPVGNVEEEADLGRPRVDLRIILAVSDAWLNEIDLLKGKFINIRYVGLRTWNTAKVLANSVIIQEEWSGIPKQLYLWASCNTSL